MRTHQASASPDLVQILLHYAANRGIELLPNELALGDSKRVPISRLNALWQAIVLRSGDPNFGLHLGEAADGRMSGGILSSVMLNCATLESAFEKLARYHDLATDFVRLRLDHRPEMAHLVWETVDATIPLDRHYIETVFCGLAFPLRRLTQGQVQPVEIRFTHACPADISEHRRIFGCPLCFDCPQNELLLRPADLATPIFQANPHLLKRLEQFTQETLAQLYPPDTWAEKVVDLIRAGLAQGEKPALDGVAAQLAFGPRQLQNKLKQEGSSYQVLLDQVRKELALQYLNAPRMTVCEIAFLLGFSEQSAFNHAFKRWTGRQPGEYRGGNPLES
jgi:AraC-like DNA-binding protein